MLELLFFIFLFGIFGKLFFFGMRAAEHFQVADYDCISSGDPAGNGIWRTFISGISDPAHYRYPFIV